MQIILFISVGVFIIFGVFSVAEILSLILQCVKHYRAPRKRAMI